MTNKPKRIFIIYDGRANYNTDDAMAMEVCESLAEAKRNVRDYGSDCVIFSYQDNNGELLDERRES